MERDARLIFYAFRKRTYSRSEDAGIFILARYLQAKSEFITDICEKHIGFGDAFLNRNYNKSIRFVRTLAFRVYNQRSVYQTRIQETETALQERRLFLIVWFDAIQSNRLKSL